MPWHSELPLPDVLFCGDPHGRFDHINSVAQVRRPHAIVLLGDMELSEDLDIVLEPALRHTRVYWICGNHDTDKEQSYQHLFNCSEHPNLVSINNRVDLLAIPGLETITIGGLGGVFRKKIWAPESDAPGETVEGYMRKMGRGNRWQGGLTLRHRSSIFVCQYEALKACKADILVTHEAPKPHAFGFQAINDLANSMGAKLVVHGHHHRNEDYQSLAHDIRGYGVGLGEIRDLYGNVIT